MHRTSIRKGTLGRFIVTNYAGKQFTVATKRRANEIAKASKAVVKKRAERRSKKHKG